MLKSSLAKKTLPGIIIGVVSICLTFEVSFASEIERVIPVLRDGSGSGIHVEIARDGARQTATPCVSLAPAVTENTASPCSIETLRKRAAQAKVSSPAVAIPDEITARNAKDVFKTLRAAWKERQAVKTTGPASGPEPVRVANQQ